MKPSLLPLVVLLAALDPLSAHECWLQPSAFSPAPGGQVRLVINVGMDFQGEARPLTPQRVAALRHHTAAGVEDWTARATATPEFSPAFAPAGTHVVAYDSAASLITLEADKFHDYLREEGLEPIIALREKAGTAAAPGRERYRRCVKTILQVGGRSDATWAVRTGQQLELVPLSDPAAVRPGGTLRFLVLLAGQPLADILVQAWHRQDDKLTMLQARTTSAGEATFTLPAAGMWMISTVHMADITGDPEADWASYWGNLTFALTAAAAQVAQTHPLKGVVMGVMTDKTALLVKHEAVPGVMRAMTMMFKVEPAVLERVKRGDALHAQMSKRDDGWWLTEIEIVPPAK